MRPGSPTEQAGQSLAPLCPASPLPPGPHLARTWPGSVLRPASPRWTSTKRLLGIEVPNSEGGDMEVGRGCSQLAVAESEALR